MKQENLFSEYLARPGAKPLWQVAYESGAGSVDSLRQIGRGERRAGAALARGIEISTGGIVSCRMLRPDDHEAIWGANTGVYERIRQVSENPEAARKKSLGKRGGQ